MFKIQLKILSFLFAMFAFSSLAQAQLAISGKSIKASTFTVSEGDRIYETTGVSTAIFYKGGDAKEWILGITFDLGDPSDPNFRQIFHLNLALPVSFHELEKGESLEFKAFKSLSKNANLDQRIFTRPFGSEGEFQPDLFAIQMMQLDQTNGRSMWFLDETSSTGSLTMVLNYGIKNKGTRWYYMDGSFDIYLKKSSAPYDNTGLKMEPDGGARHFKLTIENASFQYRP